MASYGPRAPSTTAAATSRWSNTGKPGPSASPYCSGEAEGLGTGTHTKSRRKRRDRRESPAIRAESKSTEPGLVDEDSPDGVVLVVAQPPGDEVDLVFGGVRHPGG